MKGFQFVSSSFAYKFMIICAVAVVSFAHDASAQVSSQPRPIKDWNMDGGQVFVDDPGSVNDLMRECSYLGNPPVGRSKALIKNYCKLLGKCLERKLAGGRPANAPVPPAFSAFDTPVPKIRTSPADLKQIVDAAEMACLSALLK
jgi:hypothetical protein